MVDRYYRKIEDVENDIENAMQISGILLKLKGYDKKLDNLSKIDTNTNNFSTNSGQIHTNENNISSNLGKINTNEGVISTNSKQISTNKNDISINSGRIITNKSVISTNLVQLSTNKNNISSNLRKINTNENNISSNLSITNNIKEFLYLLKILKKLLILKNKYLDLIEILIFTQFLKKKLYMISLKIVYYL